MVSTVASGNTAPYVGTSDIIMFPSIVDVSGLNSFSTKIFTNAAHAIAGMVKFESAAPMDKKPLIAATMFGVTTPASIMPESIWSRMGMKCWCSMQPARAGERWKASLRPDSSTVYWI